MSENWAKEERASFYPSNSIENKNTQKYACFVTTGSFPCTDQNVVCFFMAVRLPSEQTGLWLFLFLILNTAGTGVQLALSYKRVKCTYLLLLTMEIYSTAESWFSDWPNLMNFNWRKCNYYTEA